MISERSEEGASSRRQLRKYLDRVVSVVALVCLLSSSVHVPNVNADPAALRLELPANAAQLHLNNPAQTEDGPQTLASVLMPVFPNGCTFLAVDFPVHAWREVLLRALPLAPQRENSLSSEELALHAAVMNTRTTSGREVSISDSAIFDEVRSQYPDVTVRLMVNGMAAYQRNDGGEALVRFLLAAAVNERKDVSADGLAFAGLLLQLGNINRCACALLYQSVQLRPSHVDTSLNYGMGLLSIGLAYKAQQQLESTLLMALEQRAPLLQPLNALGSAYNSVGDADSALRLFELCGRMASDDSTNVQLIMCLSNAATLYEEKQRGDMALLRLVRAASVARRASNRDYTRIRDMDCEIARLSATLCIWKNDARSLMMKTLSNAMAVQLQQMGPMHSSAVFACIFLDVPLSIQASTMIMLAYTAAANANAVSVADNVAHQDGLKHRCNGGSFDSDVVTLNATHRTALGSGPVCSVEKPLEFPSPSSASLFGKYRRLSIAYVSTDFGDTVMLSFLRGVLQSHDKRRFRVRCISLKYHDNARWRQELVDNVEHFDEMSFPTHGTNVQGVSTGSTADGSDTGASTTARGTAVSEDDRTIATRINALGIHLAIHLDGHNVHSRVGVFAYCPARVQVSYRFASTVGAAYIPFMGTDRVVSPPDYAPQLHTEKLLYLPYNYLPNDLLRSHDRPRLSPEQIASIRRGAGIPLDAVVYVNFNRQAKFDPESFAAWCRVVSQVPGAVLWLVLYPPQTQQRLIRMAHEYGLSRDRIIFSNVVDEITMLDRAAASDIFLDTPKCNAHTTATYMLWQGVPVVTTPGCRLSARVAASLGLAALGKTPQQQRRRRRRQQQQQQYDSDVGIDMSTPTMSAFEQVALRLGQSSMRRNTVREWLVTRRHTVPLFDTSAWVHTWESALRCACELETPFHTAVTTGH